MPEQSIELRSPDGATSAAVALIKRPTASQRGVLAAAYAVGGLLLGGACIVIPIIHLVTTWALPLIGIVLAVRTMRRETIVTRVEGMCPACSKPIEAYDRGGDDPAWQLCPHCDARLQIIAPVTPAASA